MFEATANEKAAAKSQSVSQLTDLAPQALVKLKLVEGDVRVQTVGGAGMQPGRRVVRVTAAAASTPPVRMRAQVKMSTREKVKTRPTAKIVLLRMMMVRV
ncbi:MAG: hypothetical protein SGPRY_012295 [Prymnesium sp.]